VAEEKPRRVTLSDLIGEMLPERSSQDGAKVVVTRGAQKQEYNVPQEGRERGLATVGQNSAR
jgi:hypothetical protein